MHFDPNNKIVQLCAKGIELEATQPLKAKVLFMQAWSEAETDIEKFTTWLIRCKATAFNKR